MRGGICTPEATRFEAGHLSRKSSSPFFLRSLCSLTGVSPAPTVSASFNLSLLVQGPSGKRRNTPHQKEKGNQAEALRSRGELSASFSFKLDSVSVKQHTLTGTRRPKLSAVVCATLDGLLQPVKKIKGQSSRSSA